MAKKDILLFDDSTNPGQIEEPQSGDNPLIRRDYYLTTGIRYSEINDGASAVGHVLDTEDAYSTSGAKLLSVRNNGTEEFYVTYDGGFGNADHNLSSVSPKTTLAGLGTVGISCNATEAFNVTTLFGLDQWTSPGASGGSFSSNATSATNRYAWTFRTQNTFTASPSYIARFQNFNVTKVTFDKDGVIYADSDLTSGAGLGLHGNSAPAQHSSTGDTTGFVAGSGTAANSDSEWDGDSGTTGYTVGDIVSALKDIGILAA